MRTEIRWRAGGLMVSVVAAAAMSASGQQPGPGSGLQRAKPAFTENDNQRPLDRQPWVRAARRYYPEQINTVRLRGQGGEEPLEAVGGQPPEVEIVVARPAGELPPLDMRVLEARLPRSIGELRRIPGDPDEAEAGLVADPAFVVRAGYANENRSRQVTISLVDVERGLSEASRAEIRRLRAVTFHRETEDGHERAYTVQGFPAFERVHRPSGTGEVSLLVGERVGVHVQGRGVPMTTIEAAIAGLNLPALAALGF